MSRRPARKQSIRCEDCMLQTRLCICAMMPNLQNRVTLSLVMHKRETAKPTNTGHLAVMSLQQSETHIRGVLGQPLDWNVIAPSSAMNLVLFPKGAAVPLVDALPRIKDHTGPVRLIVPDGNWGQASRSVNDLEDGPHVQRVFLPPGYVSSYRLRREPADRPEAMATIEAIALAYGLLEGEEIANGLMWIFRVMVERTLWAKGMLPESEVTGGIPAAAKIPIPPES
jgi:DTW domain-containing protein YfiP